MIEIRTTGPIRACLPAPGSKSVTHRALLLASLAQGESLVRFPLRSMDTEITARACRKLGATVTWGGDHIRVKGVGGRIAGGRAVFHAGNSGTTMRLLTGILGLGHGKYLLKGSRRMEERPVEPLLEAMRGMGVECLSLRGNGCPPLLVRAWGLEGGEVLVDSSMSSQYLSALLMAAPYARKDTRIRLEGPIASRPYVEITLETMRAFGVEVRFDGQEEGFFVKAGQAYSGRDFIVEGDHSLASYFFGAAAVTGGWVRVTNLRANSRQGDRRFPDLLERMGCRVDRGLDWVEVSGSLRQGIEIDMNDMPDMVQTLAVVASFAPGRTAIRGVPHLRIKETDRLRALSRELRRMGLRIEERKDGLTVFGGGHRADVTISTYGDHRMAMSFAMAGLRVPGLRIRGEGCVRKSFPDFWGRWEGLYRRESA